MKLLSAIIFCLICVGHAHEMWANGSQHHNGGNVDNDIDVSNRNDVTNSNRTDVEVNNRAEGGDAYAVGKGGKANSTSVAGSYSGSEANVSIKGDDVEAAASSASVYLSGCQQGVAAQGLGFGASAGAESRVCQLLRLAAAHAALGQRYEAMRLVRQATQEVNGGGYTPEEAPFLARVSRGLRRHVVAPLFSWLPFIGHSV
jgi:hypothetical protein